MIISNFDTDQYLNLSDFARLVKVSPARLGYYTKQKRVETIEIGGVKFIHKLSASVWPPTPKKAGRPNSNLKLKW